MTQTYSVVYGPYIGRMKHDNDNIYVSTLRVLVLPCVLYLCMHMCMCLLHNVCIDVCKHGKYTRIYLWCIYAWTIISQTILVYIIYPIFLNYISYCMCTMDNKEVNN